MPIVTATQTADQRLNEYCVGLAGSTCTYPGIGQCFAIAGWLPSGMVCAHVSPGSTVGDIDAFFAEFRRLGGDQAVAWYVVGPFTDHFAVAKAQWRSVRHIRKAFDAGLGRTNTAQRWIADVGPERNTKVLEPGFTIPRTFNSIDIRAEHRGFTSMVVFSWKESSPRVKDWTRLPLSRFVRF